MNRHSYVESGLEMLAAQKPLFRSDESVQEVRSVENASTWRKRVQYHPHWHICCPHSNRPHGNSCSQGSCCRDDSSRLSCSRATDHRALGQ